MKKGNIWEKLKKRRKIAGGILMAAVCLGIITAAGGVFPSPDSIPSNGEIPEHDGDVLVDSIHIQEESKPEATKKEKKQKEKETELVTSDDISELKNADAYFQEMRATINMDRNQVISMLTDAETTAKTGAERESASKQKLKLLQYMEQEQNAEHMIQTKGLPECLVLITDSGVNVTVNKQELNQSDVAKICDILMRETGKKAPDIVIQSKF